MKQHKLNIGVITRFTEANYFANLLYGIHEIIKQRNANMFVINTFMLYRFLKHKSDSAYFNLAVNHMDGWIVFSEGASNEYIETLRKTGKPVVLVSFEPDIHNCIVIRDSSFYGGEVATEHLIGHGHKRIAFLGWFELYDMVERFKGYKEALRKNEIPFDPDLVIRTSGSLALSGKLAMEEILRNGPDFTAVFCANDLLAFGAMEAIKAAGLRIPQDIAVFGYDNTSQARNSSPGLSSMQQNIMDIGIAAADTLLKIIGRELTTTGDVCVRSSIVTRESCGCKEQINSEAEATVETLKLKDAVISHLESYNEKNFIIGSQLLTSSIDEMKKLMPNIVSNYSWECIGFWEENSNQEKELVIKQIIDKKSKTVLNPDVKCAVENFPPKEFLPDLTDLTSDDLVWMMPVSTTSQNWGIITYISSFNKATTFLTYDSSIVLNNLLGLAIDREVVNSELKETLETLQQTQEQLIESEKMVSLGRLVAGVAHEINTPIGVSITASTFIQEKSLELMGLFQSGKLKRGDLEKFLESCIETHRILHLNLSKASNLVNSFKQIAVDQSVEEKRWFKLKEYINEVLLSLNPKLKKTKITVVVECPEELEIYSYPGGMSQIVTNFIINSLIHAYDDGDKGTISIKIAKDGEEISFIYSDDGKGVEKSYINKIFDPFFTTKRGAGGTGLGLNIVYNIVTHEYGGSIKCESSIGNGTTFIIKIPIK